MGDMLSESSLSKALEEAPQPASCCWGWLAGGGGYDGRDDACGEEDDGLAEGDEYDVSWYVPALPQVSAELSLLLAGDASSLSSVC